MYLQFDKVMIAGIIAQSIIYMIATGRFWECLAAGALIFLITSTKRLKRES